MLTNLKWACSSAREMYISLVNPLSPYFLKLPTPLSQQMTSFLYYREHRNHHRKLPHFSAAKLASPPPSFMWTQPTLFDKVKFST